MSPKQRPLVVIIEEDRSLAAALADQLREAGLATQVFHKGATALKFVGTTAPRDIGPPKKTGSATFLDGWCSGKRLERERRVGRLTMTPMWRSFSIGTTTTTVWR